MTDNFKKILYLGAGEDIEVINIFPNCNEFILIDTKPRSEHDNENYFYEGFYRENFLKIIINKCKKYGFILEQTIELEPKYINKINIIEKDNDYNTDLNSIPYINPHLLIFNSSSMNNKIIKYYISTNILFNMHPILEKDIYEADTLYISGYHPDCELLKYFYSPIELSNGLIKKKNFVGNSYTCYYIDFEDDDNSIIKYFIQNSHLMDNYFNNYYLAWKKKSILILCDNLKDINNKRTKLNKNIKCR